MDDKQSKLVTDAVDEKIKALEPSQRQAKIFCEAFHAIARLCHETSALKGFWKSEDRGGPTTYEVDVPKRIALLHTEVSEAFEGYRSDLADDHLPDESMFSVELADVIIRIMDMSIAMNLNVEGLVIRKMVYNITRPPMHGGKKF